MRHVIHLDADAFYAAVEQRDAPSLRGKPIAVGHGANRGVVMTASYEARAFGVRSAMPAGEALRRCPELIFVPPRMDAYRHASEAIFAVYRSYTDLVEPLAFDEAFLDVTEAKRGPSAALELAEAIRSEVRSATGLVVSAGVSYGKFLAKLASAEAKPDGVFEIRREEAERFLQDLPVRRIHGVGPRTADRLAHMGIETAGALADADPTMLEATFGKIGRDVWTLARGVDDRPVQPNRERKSVSSETTFDVDRVGLMPLLAALPAVAQATARRAKRAGVRGSVVVVKVKDAAHRVTTRQRRLAAPVGEAEAIEAVAAELLATRVPLERPIRLLGVGITGLVEGEPVQPGLFDEKDTALVEGEPELG